jgi:hypothetical protein
MAPDISTPEIRRYLLGQLDEGTAAALEAHYFADPRLADDVREVELDLVDEYLSGQMAPADRARFDAHYLASPVHRNRVATARALAARLAPAAPAPVADFQKARARQRTTPALYGWLALAAALVIATLWTLSRPVQGPAQAQRQPAPAPAPAPAPVTPDKPGALPPAPAPAPAPEPAVRSVLAFTLSPIVTRGESPEPQRLPAGPADLLIRLEGPAGAADRGYAAEIQTVDGRSVWQGRASAGAAGSGILATVRVPAERLAADDYVLVLTATTPEGREERGRYVLRLRAP